MVAKIWGIEVGGVEMTMIIIKMDGARFCFYRTYVLYLTYSTFVPVIK